MSSSAPRQPWQPPSLAELQALLPAYQFLALIGHGGMGAVFKAVQLSLNRPVAIKVLPADLMEDADANFAARFRQESLTMAKLTHPGIVSVFESGESGGLLYIVMEFVDGTDVARMIAGEGKIAPELATKLLTQVCNALHYAHQNGVVHRDIKPANLLLTRDGTVKIADFGLAKHDDATLLGLTKTNVAIGTPDFLAPEAWTPNTPLDGRADVYALGVTLYQMLTGEMPRGLWKMPSVKAGVDPRFDAIIDRAMQPDRATRYQSSAELRRDLELIQREPHGAAEARRVWRRRVGMGVAAGAILVTILAVWFRPGSEARQVTVTTLDDDGPGSLRRAILESSNGTTIVFAPRLSGQAILLTRGELLLNRDLAIDGSALRDGIRLDGNRRSRVFHVWSNTVTLKSLIITNGYGGGVISRGKLQMLNCTISGNQSDGDGGGLASDGETALSGCTFIGNEAKSGGALWFGGRQPGAFLTNCLVTGNRGRLSAGGLSIYDAYVSLSACTITNNVAGVITQGGTNHDDVFAQSLDPYVAGTNSSGGILNFGGTLWLHDTVVTGNHAPYFPDLRAMVGGIVITNAVSVPPASRRVTGR